MTTRDIVVAGALPRHQVREWLYAHKIQWQEIRNDEVIATKDESTFRIDATEAQWGQIQEWVRKVTQ